ncbi:MAG TPA: glycoside hydrolase family 3 protein [Chloroflexia bacterium]|nr:glycoside hydrolase family 3 protein [Chloroflexia bacterium]
MTEYTPVPETLDFKIGQMLMIGFEGAEVRAGTPAGDALIDAISNLHVGGVIVFDSENPSAGNIRSPEQLKALSASLQRLAAVPLLIAIDQEGGNVARLGPHNGFPATPSQQHLGDLNDLAVTRSTAEATANTLREYGVNLNFAPVVDLNVNPTNPIIGSLDRCFSADPVIVAEHARAVVEAHLERGVLCSLKHFPGHGSSQADSHLGFVDVSDTWTSTELYPYKQFVAWGIPHMIMTAHIFNSHLDPDLPATLSRKTLTDLLRDELGFDGVVITDDVLMRAISSYYSFENTLELTMQAGVDIIMICNSLIYGPGTIGRAISIIRAMVERGEISPERIDRSYQRIKRLKALVAVTSDQ